MSVNTAVKSQVSESTEIPAAVATVAPIVDIRKTAQAEADAYYAQIVSLTEAGSQLGNLALEALAVRVGESTNKLGRPGGKAFVAFTTALNGRTLSFEKRADLCHKMNAAVPQGHKPAAVVSAKANDQSGSARFRFNLPVALDIAISG
jgi:hypothetical protein